MKLNTALKTDRYEPARSYADDCKVITLKPAERQKIWENKDFAIDGNINGKSLYLSFMPNLEDENEVFIAGELGWSKSINLKLNKYDNKVSIRGNVYDITTNEDDNINLILGKNADGRYCVADVLDRPSNPEICALIPFLVN